MQLEKAKKLNNGILLAESFLNIPENQKSQLKEEVKKSTSEEDLKEKLLKASKDNAKARIEELKKVEKDVNLTPLKNPDEVITKIDQATTVQEVEDILVNAIGQVTGTIVKDLKIEKVPYVNSKGDKFNLVSLVITLKITSEDIFDYKATRTWLMNFKYPDGTTKEVSTLGIYRKETIDKTTLQLKNDSYEPFDKKGVYEISKLWLNEDFKGINLLTRKHFPENI